ncbi:CRISPR-associated endoribonuclease Cas6, partial [candidate division KSB1 bacterium]|nr:CRISPR-associated endoribonuclease Cas6 [candidate division KSB1 bacterium]
HRGKLSQYYFRPGDRELSSVLMTNLLQKYELIHGESAADLKIEFTPDMNYVERRKQDGKRVTKKITIKEEDDVNSTDVIAFELPFTLNGDPELMSVAYEAGIGEKNSMGFGMIDLAVDSKNQALPKS